jgi:hypothetical protein
MNMPGFTAEVSLYQRSERYQEAIGVRHSNSNTVQPATCIGDCFQDCMAFGGMSKSGCMSLCRWECSNPF